MSDLDYDELRKVAEAATPGPWERAGTDGMGVAIHRGEHDTIALYADRPNAEHIATFDPPTVLRLLDLAQRAEAAEAKLREYDRQISWDTTCENCANLLDKSYADYVRAEKAEAAVERVRALAESWRYKGEFGWGAWQEGHGPDPEGETLDHAAAQLRAALDRKEDQ